MCVDDRTREHLVDRQFQIRSTTNLGMLFDAVCKLLELPPYAQQTDVPISFYLDGEPVFYDDTCASLGIADGATICAVIFR